MSDMNDAWLVKEIFSLSEAAQIRLVNRLFGTAYAKDASVLRENMVRSPGVRLTVRETDRYEFTLRRLDGCVQIIAEDRGCAFHYKDAEHCPVIQVREPQMIYFGKNTRKEYYTMLEFPGHGQVRLPIHTITLSDASAEKLAEAGLILFLPFLLECVLGRGSERNDPCAELKRFVLYGIPDALRTARKKGDISLFDAEKLKQLCRHTLWSFLPQKEWLQDPELQKLLLGALEADLGFLERVCRAELIRARLGQEPIFTI